VIDAGLYRRLFAELAAIGRADAGWERLAWGPGEDAARAWFQATAAALGLEVVRDPAANLWAVEPGAAEEGWVATGSHVDTVAGGGAFDGALGVVAGFVAVEAVRRARGASAAGAHAPSSAGAHPSAPARPSASTPDVCMSHTHVDGVPTNKLVGPRRPLAVGCMVDEEGPRFGAALYGSKALCGELDVDDLLARRDAAGARLGELAAARGVTAEALRAAPAFRARLASWVEVHVEQGRRLADVPAVLGVATGLAPRQRWLLRLDGAADHAGTTPMRGRRDALVAAARVILAVDAAARGEPGAVATVGDVRVEPGSSNVIPGAATLTLDVRARDADALARVRDAVQAAAADAGVPAAWTRLAVDPGSAFDAGLRQALHAAAREAGVAAADLDAYAGHDAGVLARHLPAAMLFVRNETGISHNPAEHADEEDCLAACEVLARVLLQRSYDGDA
jgi:N-carbamoyl-L-amino-acid hydrolase